MRVAPVLGLLALAVPMGGLLTAPVAAQQAYPSERGSFVPGDQVQVTARIVVVDREAFTRAGLRYVVVGNDRVRVTSTGARGGVGIQVGTHGVTAFLEAARRNRWIRSESTQQVLTMSGREAFVGSSDLAVSRRSARTRGPSLAVIPTVLDDGSVHLQVSARMEDRVTYAWGYGVDGSPAAVETELIARDGEEVILASSSMTQTTRESGLLGWGGGEEGRDVLVAVSARVR